MNTDIDFMKIAEGDKALCFDYKMLKDELSLDLETEIMDDEEDTSDDISESDI